jgi:hypothetical protein
MSPQFKKGQQESQPGGHPYRQQGGGSAEDDRLFEQWAELNERVEDAAERARLLGVPPEVEAAWHEGRGLPILKARRKALADVLRGLG